MGKHSSPEQSPFVRSLLGWLVPWMLVAVVAGIALFVAIDAVSEGPLEAKPPLRSEAPAPEETVTTPPTPESSPTPERTPKRKDPEPTPTPTARDLITEGITIQVLNATASPGAGRAMASTLEGLGFRVVVVGDAATAYERTTVFWSSSGVREAGERLARRFGWVSAPKPGNLSASVALHVVVGADET
jgi:hypothetical protein